jgi:hypothetical protein
MSGGSRYDLIVPKNNIDNFTKYILQGIYEFSQNRLWVLNPGITGRENYGVELIRETNKYYEIKFKISSSIPLINALPITSVTLGVKFFTNKEILREIKLLI